MTAQTKLAPEPQAVVSALTRAAIFLVATINPGAASRAAVRSFCGDLPGLLRAVGFRDIEGNLSCVMGIGSDAWDRLFGEPRPAELHPFREIKAGPRHAVATPGDLLFHIRAERMDLCFELATQIMAGSATRFRRSTKCTAFAISTIAICSASSTAPRTRPDKEALDAVWSAPKTPPSPAAATSSCRSTCTT